MNPITWLVALFLTLIGRRDGRCGRIPCKPFSELKCVRRRRSSKRIPSQIKLTDWEREIRMALAEVTESFAKAEKARND